jgi:hypothetical protein
MERAIPAQELAFNSLHAKKRPIYYDELNEADHIHLFQKSASFLPAVLLSPFSAWSKAFESS